MNQEQLELSDNEHIALYMGMVECKTCSPSSERHYHYPDSYIYHWERSLNYDKSWDNLMEVVTKIYSESPGEFVNDGYGPRSALAELMIYDPIEKVHAAVVAYIKNPIQR